MNQSIVVENILEDDAVAQIETITLAEFEKQLLNKGVFTITNIVQDSGFIVPNYVKDIVSQYTPMLKQGFKYFGSGKTFEALKEEDSTFYQQLLPVLHFAFQYGVYDLEQWSKLPKILIREIKYDEKGFPTFEIDRRYVKIERRPDEIEFALGIFLAEVDPLIRDLVSSLAKKGYQPVCSCQGHPRFGNKAGIDCRVKLSYDIIKFIQSRGASIDHSRYTDININHENMSPLEFLAVTQRIAHEIPKIDELRFLESESANEFREFYKQV